MLDILALIEPEVSHQKVNFKTIKVIANVQSH